MPQVRTAGFHRRPSRRLLCWRYWALIKSISTSEDKLRMTVSNNERDDDKTGVSRIPSHNTKSPGLAARTADSESPHRKTQCSGYDCKTRLVVCGPTRISFDQLHRSVTETIQNDRI